MFENHSISEALNELSTKESGLSSEEAVARLKKDGPNKLSEKKRQNAFMVFLSNFKDPMVLILFVAAIVSLVLGIFEAQSEGRAFGISDLADVIIIFGVIFLNAIIGTVQEMKAEKALEALKKLSSPTATVKRDGKLIEIKAEELVVGDIVILEEGRSVPADLRLIKSVSMKADESSLTGESLPVEKDAEIVLSQEVGVGDRVNIVYMSTPIVYGRGEGVVIATGMNTEIGRIAGMLAEENEGDTPLQKSLAKLSKFLGLLTIGIIVLMLGVSFLYHYLQGIFLEEWSQDLLNAVSLAVAAIPEGLTAVVTIVLALGMQKMIRVNTIVRRLASVETLGAVSVICSDKTGTLTQNKMTVVAAYVDGQYYEKERFTDEKLGELAAGLCLCSDASIEHGVYGDPTEVALVYFAKDFGYDKSALESVRPRVNELPFDSVRKMMSTQHDTGKGKITYTKGAMDQILKKSAFIQKGGKTLAITQGDIDEIKQASADMSEGALRVLALAIKEGDDFSEEDLTFVGLVGMVDPPREAAKPAVATLKEAGITTIMITGDHRDTAFAIAKELGIASSRDECMSGEEIDACNEEELREKLKTVRVFARVSPQNKVQIVKAVKANGAIVAMTGDGVNDAPSLKAADIGIAMGITGTDVAKGAADMVLTDDNFASIEKAVEEGRGMYANIRKTILFLLSSNIGEVICMFVAICLGLPAPLIAIHLLWVNLITDSLPAVALGADKKPDDIMHDQPRDPNEGVFAHGGLLTTFGYGLAIGAATLIAFLILPWQNGCYSIADMQAFFENEINLETAQSMAFAVLSFSELFHMLGMTDSKHSVIRVFKDKNLLLWISFFVGLGLQFLVLETPGLTYITSTGQEGFFKTYPLSDNPIDFLWVFLLALTPLIIHEITVFVLFLRRKFVNRQERGAAA